MKRRLLVVLLVVVTLYGCAPKGERQEWVERAKASTFNDEVVLLGAMHDALVDMRNYLSWLPHIQNKLSQIRVQLTRIADALEAE